MILFEDAHIVSSPARTTKEAAYNEDILFGNLVYEREVTQ